MASSWGSSWLDSWLDSWGTTEVIPPPTSDEFICELNAQVSSSSCAVTLTATGAIVAISSSTVALEIDCHLMGTMPVEGKIFPAAYFPPRHFAENYFP